jgi:hypothetical protein
MSSSMEPTDNSLINLKGNPSAMLAHIAVAASSPSGFYASGWPLVLAIIALIIVWIVLPGSRSRTG